MVLGEKLLLRYHHHRSPDILHVMLLVLTHHLRDGGLAFGVGPLHSFLRRQPSRRVGCTDGWPHHRKCLQRDCKLNPKLLYILLNQSAPCTFQSHQ